MYTSDYNYYNTYGSGMSDFSSIVGGVLIALSLFVIVAIVFSVLAIIGQWKAFKKAGKRGWECLIVGHSQFVNLEFVGVNPIWVLVLTFSSVASIIPLIGWLVILAIFVYFQYLVGISTAKSFGKSTGFGIGLAIPISAPIFWFLLGGKDVKYVGPHPVNDFVAGWFKKQPAAPQPNPNMGNEGFREVQAVVNPQPIQSVAPTVAPVAPVQPTQVVQPAASVAKFCTSCGYKITNNEKFCPGCGKAV